MNPGPSPTLTGFDLGTMGSAAYNENPGSIPNVVVRGCTVPFGGSNGLQLQANNRATFTDLADGTLSGTPWECTS